MLVRGRLSWRKAQLLGRLYSSAAPPITSELEFCSDSLVPLLPPLELDKDFAASKKVCSILLSITAPWQECRASTEAELKSLKLGFSPKLMSSILESITNVDVCYGFFTWAQQQNDFQHEPGAYEAMLQLLRKNRKYEAVDVMLAQVLEKCHNLSATLVSAFLDVYMEAGLVEKAFDAFVRLSRIRRPNITGCNAFLEMLLDAEDIERAAEMIQVMMLHGCYPEDGTFRLLMASKSPVRAFQLLKSIVEIGRVPTFGLNRPLLLFLGRAATAEEMCKLCDAITQGNFYKDVIVCNSIMNAFRLAGKCDEAYRFFEIVKENGCNPDDATYRILVLAHCKEGKMERGLSLFKTMQKLASLDVKTCNIVVHGLCKAGQVDDAAELVYTMMEAGPHPDSVTCNSLLDGLFKVNKVDHALKLFQKMVNSKFKTDSFTYNILLHGLCQAGRIDEAGNMLLEAKQKGGVSDGSLYSSFMAALCKVGKYEHAMAVFRKIRFPNLLSYNLMINACAKRGDVGAAMDLYRRMRKQSKTPDIYTFNALIQSLCKAGNVNGALKLLEQMIGMRCYPTGMTFGFLVDGLCKTRRVADAENMLRVMDMTFCPPDVVVMTTLINGYFKEGRVEDACRLFQSMEDKCKPNLRTYNIMIDGLCKAQKVGEADAMLVKMKQAEVAPDEFTFNILIDGHFKVRDSKGASSLFAEMLKIGCSRSRITFNTMVTGYCKAGEVDKAITILQSHALDHATVFMYNAVIGKLAKLGRLAAAKQFFEDMGKRGCPPDSVTYNTLIGELCRQHRVAEALELLKQMLEDKCVCCSVLSFNMVINALCKSGKMDAATELYATMKQKAISRDVITYNTLMDGYSRAGNFQESYQLFEEMLHHGCVPDTVSYNSLLECLCKDGKLKQACQKLDEMRERGCKPDTTTYDVLIRKSCKQGKTDEASKLMEEMISAELIPTQSLCIMLVDSLSKSSERADQWIQKFDKAGIKLQIAA